jgi:hypothetical protein
MNVKDLSRDVNTNDKNKTNTSTTYKNKKLEVYLNQNVWRILGIFVYQTKCKWQRQEKPPQESKNPKKLYDISYVRMRVCIVQDQEFEEGYC